MRCDAQAAHQTIDLRGLARHARKAAQYARRHRYEPRRPAEMLAELARKLRHARVMPLSIRYSTGSPRHRATARVRL